MKKIISLIMCSIFISTPTFANQSVVVSAVVGGGNHAPVILSVNPNSDPRILGVNKTQSYTLYFRDDEKNEVTYTITPANGFANPISGTILRSDYDSGSGAYINFLYLAPPTGNPNETITITINDGPSVVGKTLNLYIY